MLGPLDPLPPGAMNGLPGSCASSPPRLLQAAVVPVTSALRALRLPRPPRHDANRGREAHRFGKSFAKL